MTVALRREYTAREFNSDPSAISRAAHHFGWVTITKRGERSLVVADAAAHERWLSSEERSTSVLDSLTMAEDMDDDTVGEPPRLRIGLRAGESK
jgi:hypothetical protein